MYKIMLLVRGPKDEQSALWAYYFVENQIEPTEPVEGEQQTVSTQTEMVEYSTDSVDDVESKVEELLETYTVDEIRVVTDMTISLNIVVS